MGSLIFKRSNKGALITKPTCFISCSCWLHTLVFSQFVLCVTLHFTQASHYCSCPKDTISPQTAGSTEPPDMPPQMPHSPVKMHHCSPKIHQHMALCAGLMSSEGQMAQTPLEISSSPCRRSFTQQKDHHDQMAHMVSVWSSEDPETVLKSLSAALQFYSSFWFVFELSKMLCFPLSFLVLQGSGRRLKTTLQSSGYLVRGIQLLLISISV